MLLTWFSRRFLENEADENIPIINYFFLVSPVLIIDSICIFDQLFISFCNPTSCTLISLHANKKQKKGGWRRHTPHKMCLVFKALAKIWSGHSSQKYSNIFLTVCTTFILVNNLSLGKLCVKMTSTFQCCHNITNENVLAELTQYLITFWSHDKLRTYSF